MPITITIRLGFLRKEESTDDGRPLFGNEYTDLVFRVMFFEKGPDIRGLGPSQGSGYYESHQGSADIRALERFHSTGR